MLRHWPAIRHPRVGLYRAQAAVHWPARAEALRLALEQLDRDGDPNGGGRRIVDLGCGPGLLAPLARRLGFSYLGIDADPRFVDYCRAVHDLDRCTFRVGKAERFEADLDPRDIAVLNGLVHHLDDDAVFQALERLRAAGAMVIADHHRDPGREPRLVAWMQGLDRGPFVRDCRFFERLEGWRCVFRWHGPIDVLGVQVWHYLTYLYVPERAAAGGADDRRSARLR